MWAHDVIKLETRFWELLQHHSCVCVQQIEVRFDHNQKVFSASSPNIKNVVPKVIGMGNKYIGMSFLYLSTKSILCFWVYCRGLLLTGNFFWITRDGACTEAKFLYIIFVEKWFKTLWTNSWVKLLMSAHIEYQNKFIAGRTQSLWIRVSGNFLQKSEQDKYFLLEICENLHGFGLQNWK